MKIRRQIIIGDSRKMIEVPDEHVHLIVTSPPYWQLKDYGRDGQIGFNHSYEDYINNLNLVWNECHRVLHKGCRLCVNIGDQFARSVYYGRYKVIPIRTEITRFCETIGFDYMGAIIWQKVTTTNTTGGATIMGSFPYPRNGILKIDYEFILIFKKLGNPPKTSQQLKEQSKLTKDEWNRYFAGHWNFPGERQNKHLAMFPEELPLRLIRMFSFVGDTILDPFLGSGTTILAATNSRRNSIGYEINKDFLPIIENKLGLGQTAIFPEIMADIEIREKSPINIESEIKKLPYIFKDPTKLESKIDPRKLKFGSKIDNSEAERQDYHYVKNVLSPEMLLLDNNIRIRLLGVKEVSARSSDAIDFLRMKTRGQKVFMKFDALKYDDQDRLLCYLYLKNKTFLNAHLIKNRLVDVDTSLNYRYKSKFLSYGRGNSGQGMDTE